MNVPHVPRARLRVHQVWLRLLAASFFIFIAMFSPQAGATAAMNSCNETSNECRAPIATIYLAEGIAYVFLEGNLKPSMCTGAAYTYAWTLDLSTTGANARLSMLLAAYATGDAVELRTFASACALSVVRLGT